ncbi:ribonuclease H-like domain-containing protein, partial [Tanacetum coccineum]
TPQQNGIAERKNRTLIEAARTMLANSKLPTTLWAEAVNTACYVQNKDTLPIAKHSGYSTSRTRIVEENMHVKFSEETPNIAGNGPSTKENIDASQAGKKIVPDQEYILLPLLTSDPSLYKSSNDFPDAGFKPSGEEGKMDYEHPEN